jgi:hypothetical protein
MRKFYLFLTMMLVTAAGWSQGTYTWVGANNGNWQTASNWNPNRNVRNALDTLLFTAGNTRTIISVNDDAVGRIRVANNTNITLAGTTGTIDLTINNGTGDDFIVEAGSTLTIGSTVDNTVFANNATGRIDGTLNIDGTMSLAGSSVVVTVNGTLDNSNTVSNSTATKLVFASGGTYIHSQNGGTIPVAGWNTASTCNVTGVTTTVPNNLDQAFGNFTWNSASQSSALSFAAELATINGDFRVTSTGTGSIRLKNSGGATTNTTVNGDFYLTGGTLSLVNTSETQNLNLKGNFTMSGGTLTRGGTGVGNLIFNGTSEQVFSKTGGSITSSVNVSIASGAIVNFGTSVLDGANANFSLNAGGKMISANATGVAGSITVGGTKTFSSGADYEIRGVATGTFTTTPTASTVRNFTINNTTGDVTLNQPLAVTGALTLTDGELNTTSTNLITVNDNGTVSGASNNSFVNGPIRKVGNDAFTFPIGRNGTGYVPVAILDDNAGASNTFTAEYFRGTPPNNTNIAAVAGVNHISYCDYWSVDRTVAGDIVDVQFNWNGNNVCGGVNYVTDPSSVKVVHYNGSQWDMSSPGGGTGTSGSGSVTWTGLNNYSLFALGSTSGSANPLPVLFDNVRAYTKNDGVQLEWSNLTERDLTKYLVERSANGRDFYSINEYDPKSNQNDRADYTSFDASPLQGANFYRIKVLEVNGKIIYSKTLRVETGSKQTAFTVYPNPVKGNQVTVALTGVQQGQYSVRMFNSTGQDVFSKVITNHSTGVTQTLQLPTVKPGVYTMLINGQGYQQSQMIVIQ